MPHGGSWLYDWIDTFEITDVGQAENLLKDAGLRKDLRARASEVPFRPTPLPCSWSLRNNLRRANSKSVTWRCRGDCGCGRLFNCRTKTH